MGLCYAGPEDRGTNRGTDLPFLSTRRVMWSDEPPGDPDFRV